MKRQLITLSLGLIGLSSALVFSACSEKKENDGKTIRIGHFPNVTHVHSLVARNMERNGKGWFEERLPGYTLEWYTYNAGPSAMEAVFARSIDVTYVGPSPAINAYVRSKGEEIRIVSGAMEGGAAFVVQPDKEYKDAKDFIGTVIATPQLGNTQDVSCRAWLAANNFTVTFPGAIYKGPESNPKNGFDIRLLPSANPEQLSMFLKKNVDAVWTVEPWVTRLEQQANAKVYLEEKDTVTTILVTRVKWMEENPEMLAKLVAAHQELTDWIKAHPEEAQAMVVAELEALTRTKVNPDLIKGAWKRLIMTNEISLPGLQKFIDDAQSAGLIEEKFDAKGMLPASASN